MASIEGLGYGEVRSGNRDPRRHGRHTLWVAPRRSMPVFGTLVFGPGDLNVLDPLAPQPHPDVVEDALSVTGRALGFGALAGLVWVRRFSSSGESGIGRRPTG
jgi:hypothetical protein